MSNLQFNETFYLTTYPDVAAAVSRGAFASGQAHYQANGRFEGRNPNQFFNTSEYLGRYPDVARSGINPLTHFLTSGAAEGRFANSNEDGAIDLNNNDIADDFNSAAYLAQYPDVAAQTGAGRPFATAYQHFVQFGQFEGRTATLSNGATVTGPFANGGSGAGTPSNGSAFTFTDKVDLLNGTAGNDVFIGDKASVSVADQVNGGSGIDTVNLVGTSTLPTLTNVERLQFTAPGAAVTADVSTVAGLQEVILKNGTAASTITTALNVVTTFDATGTAGAAQAQTVATTGTATTQIVQLTNGSVLDVLTVNGAAVTNLGIQSNGSAANTIASLAGSAGQTANANSTLTINGSQKLTITGALDTDFTKVDASTSTGGVSLLFGANNVAVTGGSGADRFNFAGNLSTGDTVVGGAGVDTIAIEGTDLTTAANAQLAGLNTKVSGVEVLEFTGANAAIIAGGTTATSFTNAEITKLLFNTADAGVDTVTAAGSTRTYAFGELNTGDAAITLAAGSTSVNVSLEAIADTTPAGNTGADVGTLTVNLDAGAAAGTTSVVNLVSTGPGTVANTIAALAAVTGATTNITGSHDLTVTALTNGGTVNASAFTGKLTLTGSAVNDAITGGTGADTLIGGAGVDNVNGGAGNDLITGDAGTVVAGAFTVVGVSAAGDILTGGAGNDVFGLGLTSLANLDTITDLNLGSNVVAGQVDRLVFDLATPGAATVVAITAVQQTAITGAATFAAAADLALTALNGAANNVGQFTYGTDTYIAINGSTAGANYDAATDAIVKVTGLTGTLDASDIVVI